jgi:hypothetical protein
MESGLVRVPTVMGWLKPVILLPVGLALGLTAGQVEAILAHELAHIRRHDYLVNMVQTLVETVLFYHPATWVIGRRIRRERELCCDDAVVALGADGRVYAESLLEVARQSSLRGAALGMAATGRSGRGSELRQRILRLVGEERTGRGRQWPVVLAAGLVVLGMVLAMTLRAQGVTSAATTRAGGGGGTTTGTARGTAKVEEDGVLTIEAKDAASPLEKMLPPVLLITARNTTGQAIELDMTHSQLAVDGRSEGVGFNGPVDYRWKTLPAGEQVTYQLALPEELWQGEAPKNVQWIANGHGSNVLTLTWKADPALEKKILTLLAGTTSNSDVVAYLDGLRLLGKPALIAGLRDVLKPDRRQFTGESSKDITLTEALQLVAQYKLGELGPELKQCLKSDSLKVVKASLRAMVALPEGQVATAADLAPLAGSEDSILRRYVAGALGQAGGDRGDAVALLHKMMADEDGLPANDFEEHAFVKIWACQSLGKRGDRSGVPVLIELLRNEATRGFRGNIQSVLHDITGQSFDTDQQWMDWWKTKGPVGPTVGEGLAPKDGAGPAAGAIDSAAVGHYVDQLLTEALSKKPVDEGAVQRVLELATFVHVSYYAEGEELAVGPVATTRPDADARSVVLSRESAGKMPAEWMAMLKAPLAKRPKVMVTVVPAVPEEMRKERNAALSQAGQTLAKGLAELGAKYPYMKKATGWEDARQIPAERENLFVSAYRVRDGLAEVPAGEGYQVMVMLSQAVEMQVQWPSELVWYRSLGMTGETRATADEPELAAALKALVKKALVPVEEVDGRAARVLAGRLGMAGMTTGTAASQGAAASDPPKGGTPNGVADLAGPIAGMTERLSHITPKKWSGSMSEGKVAPLYWDEGEGMKFEWTLEEAGSEGKGPIGQVNVWIMGASYTGTLKDEGASGRQTTPAAEIGQWRSRRVFIWRHGDAWPTAQADILQALRETEAVGASTRVGAGATATGAGRSPEPFSREELLRLESTDEMLNPAFILVDYVLNQGDRDYAETWNIQRDGTGEHTRLLQHSAKMEATTPVRAATMRRAREAALKLPASGVVEDALQELVVAYKDGEKWEVREYDRRKVPAEVGQFLEMLNLSGLAKVGAATTPGAAGAARVWDTQWQKYLAKRDWSWAEAGPKQGGSWEEMWKQAEASRSQPDTAEGQRAYLRAYQRVLDAVPPKDVEAVAREEMGHALRGGFSNALAEEQVAWYAQALERFKGDREMEGDRAVLAMKIRLAEVLKGDGGMREVMAGKANELLDEVLDVPEDRIRFFAGGSSGDLNLDRIRTDEAAAQVGLTRAGDAMAAAREMEHVGNLRLDLERRIKERKAAVDLLRRGAAEVYVRPNGRSELASEIQRLEALKAKRAGDAVFQRAIEARIAELQRIIEMRAAQDARALE